MNKKELVAAVAAKTEMTQVSVEKALKAIKPVIITPTGENCVQILCMMSQDLQKS